MGKDHDENKSLLNNRSDKTRYKGGGPAVEKKQQQLGIKKKRRKVTRCDYFAKVWLLVFGAVVAILSWSTASFHDKNIIDLQEKLLIDRQHQESSKLIDHQEKYEICFVSSSFAPSAVKSDDPADVRNFFNNDPTIAFIFFTNLPNLNAYGRKKVIRIFPYKRFKTHSGSLKFMAWREPVIQQDCAFLFYMDPHFVPKQDLGFYQTLKRNILQSNGFGLMLHPGHAKGIFYELDLIGRYKKDYAQNLELTKENLKQQPDFLDKVPVYDCSFIGYDPKSLIFQDISTRFWDHYSLEQDTWRDQPWWAYTVSTSKKKPYNIPKRGVTMKSMGKLGHNGHKYSAADEGNAVHYHHKNHHPIDSCTRLTAQSKANMLASDWPKESNEGEIFERQTTTTSPFDNHWWSSITEMMGHHYKHGTECHLWKDLLQKASSSTTANRIVNIGANAGYYSLLAASLGPFVIDSFGHTKKNILQLCESAVVNRWTSGLEDRKSGVPHINVNPYGLSFSEDKKSYPDGSRFGIPQKQGSNGTITEQSILILDNIGQERGWFEEARPNIMILTIDAERLEATVLHGAQRVIKERLAQYIFVKLTVLNDSMIEASTEALSVLVKAGYLLHGQGWTDGLTKGSPWPHDVNLVAAIVNCSLARSQEQMSLLWSL